MSKRKGIAPSCGVCNFEVPIDHAQVGRREADGSCTPYHMGCEREAGRLLPCPDCGHHRALCSDCAEEAEEDNDTADEIFDLRRDLSVAEAEVKRLRGALAGAASIANLGQMDLKRLARISNAYRPRTIACGTSCSRSTASARTRCRSASGFASSWERPSRYWKGTR